MATKSKKGADTQTVTEEEQFPLMEATRKILLASIGAIALAQDEIENFISKLIERGEIAEKDGKKLLQEVMEKRRKSTEKAEDEFNRKIEDILDRMNVPSKADIDALSEQIDDVSHKVDELKKE